MARSRIAQIPLDSTHTPLHDTLLEIRSKKTTVATERGGVHGNNSLVFGCPRRHHSSVPSTISSRALTIVLVGQDERGRTNTTKVVLEAV